MGALSRGLAGLHPAYFAMVMATGIVSIAALVTDMKPVALALFWPNVGIYLALWMLYLARLVLHADRFLADLKDHNRGVGYFTMVAGTCVLGNQFVLIRGDTLIAGWLWGLGTALWLVLTYTILTFLTIKPQKPTLAEGLNGAWLLAVVATQSVSVLGGLLAGTHPEYREELLFFVLTVWLGGGMLYIWIISLIFYRYTFFPLEPAHLTPPYWINMGAMAISTLAGSLLIVHSAESPLLSSLLPFLKGFTLLYWASGTWWLPMLLVLGLWRYVYARDPMRYEPQYWSVVFPLGMYAAATHEMGRALAIPFLDGVLPLFLYAALAAWAIVAVGLAAATIQRIRTALR
jgi:tellurite resistance protein TehA-like permease